MLEEYIRLQGQKLTCAALFCNKRCVARDMHVHYGRQYTQLPAEQFGVPLYFCTESCMTARVNRIQWEQKTADDRRVYKNGPVKIGTKGAHVCPWCANQSGGSYYDHLVPFDCQNCAECRDRSGAFSCSKCGRQIVPVTTEYGHRTHFRFFDNKDTDEDARVCDAHLAGFTCGNCRDKEID